jgi:hypothetical protein
MRKRLVLCLALFLGVAGPALAEDWKTLPGEAGSFYDSDFLKVDATTGLVLARSATGGAAGKPYAAWGKGKSPIMLYALDCSADSYMYLGLDYDGAHGLPKAWRSAPKDTGIGAGVGALGKQACAAKDGLPKATLP